MRTTVTAGTAVPKTAVNEDGDLACGEHKIRGARQIFHVHSPAADAGSREPYAQRQFSRFDIAILHRSHDRGAGYCTDVIPAPLVHASATIAPKCEANAAESTGGTAFPT